MFEVIAFDGDDTLWHNESIFSLTQARFRALLERYVAAETIDRQLLATETGNLGTFGYGIKGFTLSMIETAIEVTQGHVAAADIQAIIQSGKAMLAHPVELLDGVSATLTALASSYRLMLLTKGDLFDQESKIARSGLADLFWKIEILSEKHAAAYRRVLSVHDVDAARFLMVGNSMRSDILPVLEIGGTAVHIPYHLTWAHEASEGPAIATARFTTLESITALPGLLARLGSESAIA